MTRYERIMESVNTPEKLIDFINQIDGAGFGVIISDDYCKGDCIGLPPQSECEKCKLKYLNETINS